MSPTTLEVKQLKKTFQEDLILNDLSFQLNKGEILSVVGPSGSGKTTLLRVLAGLESPTNGSLWMNGKDITATKANRRDISLVFQQPLLFPHMTVKENIAYGAKVSKKYSKPKIERLMEAIGMSPVPRSFSFRNFRRSAAADSPCPRHGDRTGSDSFR